MFVILLLAESNVPQGRSEMQLLFLCASVKWHAVRPIGNRDHIFVHSRKLHQRANITAGGVCPLRNLG